MFMFVQSLIVIWQNCRRFCNSKCVANNGHKVWQMHDIDHRVGSAFHLRQHCGQIANCYQHLSAVNFQTCISVIGSKSVFMGTVVDLPKKTNAILTATIKMYGAVVNIKWTATARSTDLLKKVCNP